MTIKQLLSTLNLLLMLIAVGCVQETHLKTVTFKVDMSKTENVIDVGIRGQFTDPPWQQTVPMTDDDEDGIYEVTLTKKTAFNWAEFKFVKNNDEFELQGQDNRVLQMEYKPETIEYIATFDQAEGKQITK